MPFVQGIEEDDVSPGFVLCDSQNPITTGRKFDAQVVILEHKSIICAGYSAVMHIHCAAEEVNVNVSVRSRFGPDRSHCDAGSHEAGQLRCVR